MAIRKVARMGNPVLRTKARELTPGEIQSPEVQRLIDDMVETLREYDGVGLAAPQVHEPLRISVVEFSASNPRYDIEAGQGLTVYVNPRVTVLDPTEEGLWEGCLSVPGLKGWVMRPRKIRVESLDRHAKPVTITAEGFLATVLQHEFDHLDGVLYVDRIKDKAKFAFAEELAKFRLAAEDL